jgi:RHS repeat-associated protein
LLFDNLIYSEVENLSYRPFGGAKAMSNGGGGSVGSQFDDAGRITVSTPGAEHEETLTYDNNGNLISISAPSLPYHNRVYGYDALDRLEHAEGPWGNIDYTYNDVGNRLTKTVDSVTETYAYLAGTNILDTVTNGESTTFTHDANGNIAGINNRVLIYNQNNRLISVEEDSVTLGEYTYNGLGQRIIKEAGGLTTIFHYDFDGNIIAESDESGNFDKEYLYRSSSRLALVDVETGELYYYGNDRLGTPQILTDSTNTVVWEAVYDPFGEADINPNSTVVSNFRFPGQYYDSETGLHYNSFRYYDPSTGRYLTPDPAGQLGGINLFVYVENNPVNWFDPDGLITRPVPGPIRGPDAGASEGGGYGVRRTRNGVNYPHTGVDLLHPAGGNVVTPIGGAVSPSGAEGILICNQVGTMCCDGESRPKLICWRLVHINPSVTSGTVREGQVVGTVAPQNAPIPSHVHVEYYESTCDGMTRSDPTPHLPQ